MAGRSAPLLANRRWWATGGIKEILSLLYTQDWGELLWQGRIRLPAATSSWYGELRYKYERSAKKKTLPRLLRKKWPCREEFCCGYWASAVGCFCPKKEEKEEGWESSTGLR